MDLLELNIWEDYLSWHNLSGFLHIYQHNEVFLISAGQSWEATWACEENLQVHDPQDLHDLQFCVKVQV